MTQNFILNTEARTAVLMLTEGRLLYTDPINFPERRDSLHPICKDLGFEEYEIFSFEGPAFTQRQAFLLGVGELAPLPCIQNATVCSMPISAPEGDNFSDVEEWFYALARLYGIAVSCEKGTFPELHYYCSLNRKAVALHISSPVPRYTEVALLSDEISLEKDLHSTFVDIASRMPGMRAALYVYRNDVGERLQFAVLGEIRPTKTLAGLEVLGLQSATKVFDAPTPAYAGKYLDVFGTALLSFVLARRKKKTKNLARLVSFAVSAFDPHNIAMIGEHYFPANLIDLWGELDPHPYQQLCDPRADEKSIAQAVTSLKWRLLHDFCLTVSGPESFGVRLLQNMRSLEGAQHFDASQYLGAGRRLLEMPRPLLEQSVVFFVPRYRPAEYISLLSYCIAAEHEKNSSVHTFSLKYTQEKASGNGVTTQILVEIFDELVQHTVLRNTFGQHYDISDGKNCTRCNEINISHCGDCCLHPREHFEKFFFALLGCAMAAGVTMTFRLDPRMFRNAAPREQIIELLYRCKHPSLVNLVQCSPSELAVAYDVKSSQDFHDVVTDVLTESPSLQCYTLERLPWFFKGTGRDYCLASSLNMALTHSDYGTDIMTPEIESLEALLLLCNISISIKEFKAWLYICERLKATEEPELALEDLMSEQLQQFGEGFLARKKNFGSKLLSYVQFFRWANDNLSECAEKRGIFLRCITSQSNFAPRDIKTANGLAANVPSVSLFLECFSVSNEDVVCEPTLSAYFLTFLSTAKNCPSIWTLMHDNTNSCFVQTCSAMLCLGKPIVEQTNDEEGEEQTPISLAFDWLLEQDTSFFTQL